MKIKQKATVNLIALFALTVALAVLSPAPSVEALTNNEKKQCYETWAGRYTGVAGDGERITGEQLARFENGKCSQDNRGSCKINRYEDGAAIQCQRKDNKYDDGSGGWNGTEGGADDGNTGDDGTVSSGTGCGGAETSIIKCDADNSGDLKDNGVWGLLLLAINIMTAGIGVVAVGGIVYGSVLYASAGDKAEQVKKAIGVITNVVIGVFAYIAMYALLQFLIPGGVFS